MCLGLRMDRARHDHHQFEYIYMNSINLIELSVRLKYLPVLRHTEGYLRRTDTHTNTPNYLIINDMA